MSDSLFGDISVASDLRFEELWRNGSFRNGWRSGIPNRRKFAR
jgi:hypothetical protein